jgi:Cu-Zn family superoxide dismutase
MPTTSLRRVTTAATVTAATVATTLGVAAAPAQAAPVIRVDGPTVVHDATLFPAGGTARVQAVLGGTTTLVRLQVSGLIPNRRYGSHVHYLPCGATPAASGAHYQYVPDPATGGSPTVTSTNPAYANPRNEIWLDFTTNAAGSATATSIVAWRMPTDRRAQSVVIHAMGTDETGAAGARLACITVPF